MGFENFMQQICLAINLHAFRGMFMTPLIRRTVSRTMRDQTGKDGKQRYVNIESVCVGLWRDNIKASTSACASRRTNSCLLARRQSLNEAP